MQGKIPHMGLFGIGEGKIDIKSFYEYEGHCVQQKAAFFREAERGNDRGNGTGKFFIKTCNIKWIAAVVQIPSSPPVVSRGYGWRP